MKPGMRFMLVILLTFCSLTIIECGTKEEPALIIVEVSPSNPSVALGRAMQVEALGTFTDGTKRDVTSGVTWSSSNESIAVISNETGSAGLITSAATGSATITAKSGDISGSTTLTVTDPELVSIAISPAIISLASATTQQFTAIGTYSDGTLHSIEAGWTSSDPSVAIIVSCAGSTQCHNHGMAKTVSAGTTTINGSAFFAGTTTINGSARLTVNDVTVVSISITPANPSIIVGGSQLFTATGSFSDGTSQDITSFVIWTSSDQSVATIFYNPNWPAFSIENFNIGRADSRAKGITTITATYGSIASSVTLTVN